MVSNNAKTNHESRRGRDVAKAYGRKDGKIQLKQMQMHGSKKSKLSKKIPSFVFRGFSQTNRPIVDLSSLICDLASPTSAAL